MCNGINDFMTVFFDIVWECVSLLEKTVFIHVIGDTKFF